MPSERPHAYGPDPLPVELDRDGAVILAGDSVEVLPRLRGDQEGAVARDRGLARHARGGRARRRDPVRGLTSG